MKHRWPNSMVPEGKEFVIERCLGCDEVRKKYSNGRTQLLAISDCARKYHVSQIRKQEPKPQPFISQKIMQDAPFVIACLADELKQVHPLARSLQMAKNYMQALTIKKNYSGLTRAL